MLTFHDIKNDVTVVLDYVDNTLLTDSTITMMPDAYIKKSVRDRLTQVVLMQEGAVSFDEDAKSLSKAMLRASLTDKDINLILNASLKVSDTYVSITTSKELSDTEEANKMIQDKLDSMCSIESLITIIKDNLGSSRVAPTPSSKAVAEALEAKLDTPVNDMLYIERPLSVNLDYIDLSSVDNNTIFALLNSMMASDSNSELGIAIPIEALIFPLKEFLTTDLNNVADAVVTFAKSSAKNSIMFNSEPDPYQSLFGTL